MSEHREEYEKEKGEKWGIMPFRERLWLEEKLKEAQAQVKYVSDTVYHGIKTITRLQKQLEEVRECLQDCSSMINDSFDSEPVLSVHDLKMLSHKIDKLLTPKDQNEEKN